MGSGRTGVARSATSASVASMAFVAANKMCELIYLFAWLTSAELLHYPKYQNLFCRNPHGAEKCGSPRGNLITHAWIYLAIYAAFVVYVILDAIPGIVPGPASR